MRNIAAILYIFSIIALPAAGQPPAPVKLAVSGDVAMPLTLTAADLAQMPRATVRITGAGGATEYEGVWLREILARAGFPMGKSLRGKALASYVVAKASDGYQVAFTPAELDPQLGGARILVADKRDGQPLPADLGPPRIVCPDDKEGARSVRMLEGLEVVQLRK